MPFTAILFALVLSITDYLTEHVINFKRTDRLISFTAGVVVAYLFLEMMPSLYRAVDDNGTIFFAALMGFAFVHISEKYFYESYKRHGVREAHRKFHIAFSFTYKFILGVVIAGVVSENIRESLLFFIPLLLYIVVETLPYGIEIKGDRLAVAHSLAPVGGVIFASYAALTQHLTSMLNGIVAGSLLYLIIREAIPKEREGKPLMFLAGMVSYSVVLSIAL